MDLSVSVGACVGWISRFRPYFTTRQGKTKKALPLGCYALGIYDMKLRVYFVLPLEDISAVLLAAQKILTNNPLCCLLPHTHTQTQEKSKTNKKIGIPVPDLG